MLDPPLPLHLVNKPDKTGDLMVARVVKSLD